MAQLFAANICPIKFLSMARRQFETGSKQQNLDPCCAASSAASRSPECSFGDRISQSDHRKLADFDPDERMTNGARYSLPQAAGADRGGAMRQSRASRAASPGAFPLTAQPEQTVSA
jgi:hypothetical protein